MTHLNINNFDERRRIEFNKRSRQYIQSTSEISKILLELSKSPRESIDIVKQSIASATRIVYNHSPSNNEADTLSTAVGLIKIKFSPTADE